MAIFIKDSSAIAHVVDVLGTINVLVQEDVENIMTGLHMDFDEKLFYESGKVDIHNPPNSKEDMEPGFEYYISITSDVERFVSQILGLAMYPRVNDSFALYYIDKLISRLKAKKINASLQHHKEYGICIHFAIQVHTLDKVELKEFDITPTYMVDGDQVRVQSDILFLFKKFFLNEQWILNN